MFVVCVFVGMCRFLHVVVCACVPGVCLVLARVLRLFCFGCLYSICAL